MAFNPTVGWGKDGLAYSIRSTLDREHARRAAGWDITMDGDEEAFRKSGVCASLAAIMPTLAATPRPAIGRGRSSAEGRKCLEGPKRPQVRSTGLVLGKCRQPKPEQLRPGFQDLYVAGFAVLHRILAAPILVRHPLPYV